MKIFTNRTFKLFFCTVIFAFVSMTVLLQAILYFISEDYKNQLISHDYKLAGYLQKNSLDKTRINHAFTAEKNEEDYIEGKKLLEPSGYSANTDESLISETYSIHKKYSIIMFLVALAAAAVILAIILIFGVFQDNELQKAHESINDFMKGNFNNRLVDREEGSLSKLFSSINSMATSLTTHIAKEKENKEFLRDTIQDISHQLKTPLAALKMYNEIIQEERVQNEVVNNFIKKSCNELNRIESLILNLLKLAKLDANSIELDKNKYNLKEFLEVIINRFHTRADIENKTVNLKCDENMNLYFDREWLLEAVSNILKNSLDHTKAGNKINIICEESSLMTQIIIKDNGKGIHSEDIQYIFQRFYRSRFSKDSQGIGIGLTISKSIIEKHGGSIIVESGLGKGSTFYLNFPKIMGIETMLTNL